MAEEEYELEVLRIERELTHPLHDRAFRGAGNQRLLNELGRHHDPGNLLRFLFEDEVVPTNNRSERALRPGEISRKVSQCSKTWNGAEAYTIFVILDQNRTQARCELGRRGARAHARDRQTFSIP